MDAQCPRLTFRVRQIPAHCIQFHDLTRLLHYVLDYQKTIIVRSLASSIDSFENPPTKVATVTFEDRPTALEDPKNPRRSEWFFPSCKTSLPHNIIIDTHFRGFTVLNEVYPERHLLDCIAVSGLAGHAFGSWSSRDDMLDFMWLRDAVPKRFNCMRVLIYGYDSHLLNSESFQTIRNISLAFINKIRSLGLAEPSAKPVLFLAHSLGGIVVKQAMVHIANTPALERAFLPKVKRAIFFGVPNKGMLVSHLLQMVEHQPNEPLIRSLCEDSPYLAQLDEQFYGISFTRKMEIVSVYETHKSQTPQMMSNGQWERAGPFEILVNPESAIQRGTKEEDQHPVDKDHSNLVKFAENDDDLGACLYFMQPLYHRLRQLHSTRAPVEQDANLFDNPINTMPVQGVQNFHNSLGIPKNPSVTAQKQAMLQSILQSICADETDHRYRAIEAAHESTFDWILTRPELGILDWIRQGKEVFWINGKPGSGKSTAMKHIYEHYRAVQKSAYQDSSTTKEIIAKFFFFQRGSSIQKSFEGLLRSILYQVLSSAGEMAELILPTWLQMSAKRRKKWSPIQIDAAWEQILEQQNVKLNITLFLDALDEFDGPIEKVVRFVERTASQPTASMTQVRICCASRPWNVFNDRFSRYPGFQMENYTERDIIHYVWATMYEHEATKIWLNSPEPAERASAQKLISLILNQAKGVFIWVKLVLQNLLDACTAGAELQELDEIVTSLPPELEDLYEALLDRVRGQGYHYEAYAMLEILVRAPRPLTLHEFRCIVKCATLVNLDRCVDALQSTSPRMSATDIDAFRRRIRSRCGGLVEIVTTQHDENSESLLVGYTSAPRSASKEKTVHVVQLMHQTVKDFVTRPGFKGVLDLPNNPISSENGHSFLAKFGLAMIKGATSRSGGLFCNRIPWLSWERGEELFALCSGAFYHAELTTGLSQSRLLESIRDQQFADFFPQDRYDNDLDAMMDYRPRQWPIDSRLSFAVVMRLLIYLKSKLQINAATPIQGVPIIHAVIETIHHEPFPDRTAIAQILLRHSANVHETFENLNPFQALFRCRDPTIPPIRTIEAIGRMTKLLLEHGSDPDADIFYLFDNIDWFHRDSAIYTSKALHVTVGCPTMIRLLLDYGANVNGLNGQGQTPLDVIVSYAVLEREEYGSGFNTNACCESAKILMQNGGRVTQQSLDVVFLDYEDSEEGGEIEEGKEEDDDDSRGPENSISIDFHHTKANKSNVYKRRQEELPKISCLQRFMEEEGYNAEVQELLTIPTLWVSPANLRSAKSHPQLILPSRRNQSAEGQRNPNSLQTYTWLAEILSNS